MICATKPRIRYVQILADYGVTPTGESPDDGPDDGPTGFSIFLDTEPDPRDAEAGRAAPAMLLTPGGVVRVPVGVDVANFVTALARLDAAVPFIGRDNPPDTGTPGRLGFRSLPDGSLALTDADGTIATLAGRPVILTLTDLETFANRSGPIAPAERYALTGKGPAADGDATGGDDPTLSAAVAGTATLAIPQMATSAIRFPIDSLLRGGLTLSGIGTFLTAFLDSTPLNQGEDALLSTVADGDIVRNLMVQSAAGRSPKLAGKSVKGASSLRIIQPEPVAAGAGKEAPHVGESTGVYAYPPIAFRSDRRTPVISGWPWRAGAAGDAADRRGDAGSGEPRRGGARVLRAWRGARPGIPVV